MVAAFKPIRDPTKAAIDVIIGINQLELACTNETVELIAPAICFIAFSTAVPTALIAPLIFDDPMAFKISAIPRLISVLAFAIPVPIPPIASLAICCSDFIPPPPFTSISIKASSNCFTLIDPSDKPAFN